MLLTPGAPQSQVISGRRMSVFSKVVRLRSTRLICQLGDQVEQQDGLFQCIVYHSESSRQITLQISRAEVLLTCSADNASEEMTTEEVWEMCCANLSRILESREEELQPLLEQQETSKERGRRLPIPDENEEFEKGMSSLHSMKFEDAAAAFKRVISVIRKKERKSRSCNSALVSSAYFQLGQCFEGLNQNSKAEANYILSCKFCSEDDANGRMARESLKRLRLNKMSSTSNAKCNDTNTADVDIENFLDRHKVYPLQPSSPGNTDEMFNFSCTMCGECCRSADYLLLTPHDIFLMTRSKGLSLQGIKTTTQLLTHPSYEGVFHYTQRGNYSPVCFLRPAQQLDRLGHCHFAYPLFTKPSPLISQDRSGEQTREALCEVFVEESDSDSHEAREEQGNGDNISSDDKSRQLVSFSEYFLSLPRRPSGSSGEQQEEVPVAVAGRWRQVLNAAGRPALGCLLGPSQPLPCRCFPAAPELSVADPWHQRSALMRGAGPAAGWQAEERYVAVQQEERGCEGFGDRKGSEKTPIRRGRYLNKSEESEESGSDEGKVSMREFLGDGLDRLEESQWLLALMSSVTTYFEQHSTLSASSGGLWKALRVEYMNRLARIWYDFDSLRAFRARPVRSYRRLKSDISRLTWVLVRETVQFLAEEAEGEEVSQLVSRYSELLNRLGLS